MILWGAYVNRPPTALAFLAFQLPNSTDSMHSEALGLQKAACFIAGAVTKLCTSCALPLESVFQMDNLPIVRHINKEAKCTHIGAANAIAEALAAICPKISNLVFEYIPRESNFFGDLAAGIESSSLLTNSPTNMEPQLEPQATDSPIFHEQVATLSLPVLVNKNINQVPAGSKQISLTEKLCVEIPLLRAFSHSLVEHQRTAQWHTYLNVLLTQEYNTGLQVQYSSRRGARLYALSPAAQLLQ